MINQDEILTIDVDMAEGDDAQAEREIAKAIKKYNLTREDNGAGYDLTGKRKDLLAYLKSDFYGVDDSDIEDLWPELLEMENRIGKLNKKKFKKGYKTLKQGNVKEGYSKLKNIQLFEDFNVSEAEEATKFKVHVEDMDDSAKIVDQGEADTKEAANKIKKEMMKKHELINHAGHVVNYKKRLELFTNY